MCTILVTKIEENNIDQPSATHEVYMLSKGKDERWKEAAFLEMQPHTP